MLNQAWSPKGTMHYSQIVLIVHKKNDGASYMKMVIVFCQHILLTISEKIECLAMKIWYTIPHNLVQVSDHANSEEYYVWVWLIISSNSKLDHVKSGLIPKGYHALFSNCFNCAQKKWWCIVHENDDSILPTYTPNHFRENWLSCYENMIYNSKSDLFC